jgi:hypothetical protein
MYIKAVMILDNILIRNKQKDIISITIYTLYTHNIRMRCINFYFSPKELFLESCC